MTESGELIQAEAAVPWPPSHAGLGAPKLYVCWTTPCRDQAVHREVLLDLVGRMEELFEAVGLTWRREALIWGTEHRVLREANWTPRQEEKSWPGSPRNRSSMPASAGSFPT